MVRSERGRTGRHVMICNVVDANIFGQCWLPAKRVKILFPCDRCVCFFVGIGRALRTQRKVSLFVVVFLSFFLVLCPSTQFVLRFTFQRANCVVLGALRFEHSDTHFVST